MKLKTIDDLTNNGMVEVDQSNVSATGSLKFVALNIESKMILFFSSKLIPEKSTVLDSVVFDAIFSKKDSNSMPWNG